MPTVFRSRAKFGLNKTTDALIHFLLTHVDGFYLNWIKSTRRRQDYLKKEIRLIIKSHLLGSEFLATLATEVLKDGSVDVENKIFQYLKKRVYQGDIRKLLIELHSTKEQ